MDLYNIIAGWTDWPAMVALLLVAGAYGYWVIHARSELLEEKNEWLEAQLKTLKEHSPDILAQQLADRLRLLGEELQRLKADHEASQESIRNKEAELAEVEAQIGNLTGQLAKAQDLLQMVSDSGLVCPQCGAPLEVREYHSESVEYEGRDLDVDHEIIRYECGLEILDGEARGTCSRSGPPATRNGEVV